MLNHQQQIETILESTTYPDDFKAACGSLVNIVFELLKNGQLSFEESKNLLQKTQHLASHPEDYKIFLTEAKRYQLVAGGRLAAYMMLTAGWAARIVTANRVGGVWIRLANEKLSYLAAAEGYAKASKAYSGRKR